MEGKTLSFSKLIEVFFFYFKCGNSTYGKCISNQMKHRHVEYCSDAEASHKVNTSLFRKLDNITEDTYEVESSKKNKFTNSSRFFCLLVHETSHVAVLL